MKTNDTQSTKMKLSDMGTTGLVQYAINGPVRLRGARTGKAVATSARRYKSWDACNRFRKAVNSALGFAN